MSGERDINEVATPEELDAIPVKEYDERVWEPCPSDGWRKKRLPGAD